MSVGLLEIPKPRDVLLLSNCDVGVDGAYGDGAREWQPVSCKNDENDIMAWMQYAASLSKVEMAEAMRDTEMPVAVKHSLAKHLIAQEAVVAHLNHISL